MKSRYDGIPGKEAGRLSKMDRMYQSEHSESNSFVKKGQNALESLGMKKEVHLNEKYMRMDQCMISDGEHAQKFARELTGGLDKKAFPVK